MNNAEIGFWIALLGAIIGGSWVELKAKRNNKSNLQAILSSTF